MRAGKHWHFPALGSSDWHHLSGSEPEAATSQEEHSECFIWTSHYICPFLGHNTTQSYGTTLSKPLSLLLQYIFVAWNEAWGQACVELCVQFFDLDQYNVHRLVLCSYFKSALKQLVYTSVLTCKSLSYLHMRQTDDFGFWIVLKLVQHFATWTFQFEDGVSR